MEDIEKPQDTMRFNQDFVSAIEGSSEGQVKDASQASGKMIRKRLRENGYLRHIIPPENATTAMLAKVLEHDHPVIIEDMEPDSPGAKTIPFHHGPDTTFYRGDKFLIKFEKITTREFAKNIQELRTYTIDLRQVVTDNALKDLQTEEDTSFTNHVDRLVGSEGGVGASGQEQNFLITGGITRASYAGLVNHLEDLELNNGVFLINRHTYNEFLKFGRDEMGGDLAQETLLKGRGAFAKAELVGVPHIVTIKRGLVPDNVVYQFAEPNFMGRFYILEDVVMYVERKRDIIKFNAEEKIGVAVPNVRSLCRSRFSGG
jgi:hypothetical protein